MDCVCVHRYNCLLLHDTVGLTAMCMTIAYMCTACRTRLCVRRPSTLYMSNIFGSTLVIGRSMCACVTLSLYFYAVALRVMSSLSTVLFLILHMWQGRPFPWHGQLTRHDLRVGVACSCMHLPMHVHTHACSCMLACMH